MGNYCSTCYGNQPRDKYNQFLAEDTVRQIRKSTHALRMVVKIQAAMKGFLTRKKLGAIRVMKYGTFEPKILQNPIYENGIVAVRKLTVETGRNAWSV
jgi:hypothetical protein